MKLELKGVITVVSSISTSLQAALLGLGESSWHSWDEEVHSDVEAAIVH